MEKQVIVTNNIEACSFKLLFSCPSGLYPSQMFVEFSDAYDRIPSPDIKLKNAISEMIQFFGSSSTPPVY